jgi:hypothetical protein
MMPIQGASHENSRSARCRSDVHSQRSHPACNTIAIVRPQDCGRCTSKYTYFPNEHVIIDVHLFQVQKKQNKLCGLSPQARTTPTERPPLIGEVSGNFSG